MTKYILKMDNPKDPDDYGIPTRVRLIGPFPDDYEEPVGRWIEANNPHDNPCWQVVDLDEADDPTEIYPDQELWAIPVVAP